MNELTQDQKELAEIKTDLLSSFLHFTQVFYKLRTGRDFIISKPICRESHFITIAKQLTKVHDGEISRLIINVPPRHGKTELLIHFVAWCIAHNPDSNFLYVSYSHSLAKKQTQTIREIISLPYFRDVFGIRVSEDSSAKDDFTLDTGGSVYAAGAGGTITGHGAGIMGCDRFGGAIIIDDIHKPDEATSDVIREGIIDWYYNTMQSRLNNGEKTPIIFIGQRVHEYDLAAHLLKQDNWHKVVLKAIDTAGNAIYPELQSKEELLNMQNDEEYVFAAQYQQDPQPAGGGLFKEEDFLLLEYEPNILATFITADSAETEKEINDATVFSFWGLYKVVQANIETDIYALHWLNCVEIRVEPKDLYNEFMQFYATCMRYKVKPQLAAIEKKSTGVTLLSVLKQMQGLRIMDIERTITSKTKCDRFISIQQYIASKLITLPIYSRHAKMCIEHCKKITANNSHRFDDIADTLYDAVKIGLIDKLISAVFVNEAQNKTDETINKLMGRLRSQQQSYYNKYNAGRIYNG